MVRSPVTRHKRKMQPAAVPLALPPDRLTFLIPEVVAMTGIAESVIYQMLASGELRSTKVRRRRLIFADSLRELLDPANAARRSPNQHRRRDDPHPETP